MGTINISAYDPQTLKLIGSWYNFKFLQIRREINKPGYYQLILDHRDNDFDNLVLDSILQFTRTVSAAGGGDTWGTGPRTEFWGLHRTKVKAQFSTGLGQYSSFGRGTLDLVNRRIIARYAETELTSGGNPVGSLAVNVPADIAIYRYVDQHCGAKATMANGRLYEGVTPNFSVSYFGTSTSGTGVDYSGENAWRNLLSVAQEISDTTHQLLGTPWEFGMEFDIENNEHDFKLFEGGIGTDRSVNNTLGNTPIIFSTHLGNIQDVWVSYTRSEEINRVYALGDGDALARSVQVVQDTSKIPVSFGGTDAEDTSIYNLIETSRDATGDSTSSELTTFAAQHLWKNKAEPHATFIPLQFGPYMYGRDYFLGDRITVRHEDFDVDLRIRAVELLYDSDGIETIKLEFAEKPGQISASYYSVNPSEGYDNSGDIELIYELLKDQKDDESKRLAR